MTGHFPPVPEACRRSLAEIEADPLGLSEASEAHVRTCRACAETRVAWLAQEESVALAPQGYFEHLPGRILGKLPTRSRRRPHLALWAMAAALLLTVGAGGFLAGRANRTPMVEATLVQPAPETRDATLPDTPFQEAEDDYAQLPNLSPEEAHRLIDRVKNQAPQP